MVNNAQQELIEAPLTARAGDKMGRDLFSTSHSVPGHHWPWAFFSLLQNVLVRGISILIVRSITPRTKEQMMKLPRYGGFSAKLHSKNMMMPMVLHLGFMPSHFAVQ